MGSLLVRVQKIGPHLSTDGTEGVEGVVR
jgi:hypothetical protein